jgi:molybdenum cofactor guanylyltransferase
MRDQEIVQAKDITTPIPLPHLLIGVVLAGGQSSRMGRDKALLTLRGKTFLSLARQALIDLGCARVVMSGAPRAEWNGQHVPDMMANMGPVGGMVSCIDTLANEQNTETHETLLVFVAVDTPLLTLQSLAPLLAPALSQPSLATGAHYANHPIPLVLRLTPTVCEHAQTTKRQLMTGQSCSIATFTNSFGLDCLSADKVQSKQLSNINTPDDWSHLNHEFADQSR